MKFFILSLAGFYSYTFTIAQSVDTFHNKNFSLFHPVPEERMREFSTDRPDVTESPYTVDAGHFQLETDVVKATYTKTSTETSTYYSFNAANLKIGLSNSVDLQAVIETFRTVTTRSYGEKFQEKGIGDLTLRVKKNIFGNNGGGTSLALLPFLNIPLHAGKNISGGLAVPFGFSLGKGWDAGAQAQVDLEKNSITKKLNSNFLTSFTVGYSLAKQLDIFLESVIVYDSFGQAFETSLNSGPVFHVTKNFNIDAGINYGLKKESAKIFFLGFSLRR